MIANATRVTEITGGRYDGDFRTEAECPGCKRPIFHIMDAEDYGPSPRLCNARCGHLYDLTRPRMGLFDLPMTGEMSAPSRPLVGLFTPAGQVVPAGAGFLNDVLEVPLA